MTRPWATASAVLLALVCAGGCSLRPPERPDAASSDAPVDVEETDGGEPDGSIPVAQDAGPMEAPYQLAIELSSTLLPADGLTPVPIVLRDLRGPDAEPLAISPLSSRPEAGTFIPATVTIPTAGTLDFVPCDSRALPACLGPFSVGVVPPGAAVPVRVQPRELQLVEPSALGNPEVCRGAANVLYLRSGAPDHPGAWTRFRFDLVCTAYSKSVWCNSREGAASVRFSAPGGLDVGQYDDVSNASAIGVPTLELNPGWSTVPVMRGAFRIHELRTRWGQPESHVSPSLLFDEVLASFSVNVAHGTRPDIHGCLHYTR